MSVNSYLERITITDKNNEVHVGVRPSLLESPFKNLSILLFNDIEYSPPTTIGRIKIVGYKIYVTVDIGLSDGSENLYWKVICLLESGDEHTILIDSIGQIK